MLNLDLDLLNTFIFDFKVTETFILTEIVFLLRDDDDKQTMKPRQENNNDNPNRILTGVLLYLSYLDVLLNYDFPCSEMQENVMIKPDFNMTNKALGSFLNIS